jgi:hypothetical protein
MRCDGCKFWTREWPDHHDRAAVGTCGKISQTFLNSPDSKTNIIFFGDDEPDFWAAPDFGCVLFEEKSDAGP